MASDEGRLLLTCARVKIDAPRRETIRSLLAKDLDWSGFIALARRHGVASLLYQALKNEEAVPAFVLNPLHREYTRNTAQALLLAHELPAVLRLLQSQGISALAFKGPALAILAYRDLTLRHVGDLDLVIRKADLARATAVLEAAGYRLMLTRVEQRHFLNHRYHFHFRRDNPEVQVELHWAFTPAHLPFPVDEDLLWRGQILVDIAGSPVPTLSPEASLLTLSANGGKEGWRRACQMCDVAELIGSHPEMDWDRIWHAARRTGRARVFILGVALSHELLGARLPAGMIRQIRADPGLESLIDRICEGLGADPPPSGVYFHYYAANVWHNRADRVRYLRHVLRMLPAKLIKMACPTARDRSQVRLPACLSFLYYLLRPFLLVASYRSPRLLAKLLLLRL